MEGQVTWRLIGEGLEDAFTFKAGIKSQVGRFLPLVWIALGVFGVEIQKRVESWLDLQTEQPWAIYLTVIAFLLLMSFAIARRAAARIAGYEGLTPEAWKAVEGLREFAELNHFPEFDGATIFLAAREKWRECALFSPENVTRKAVVDIARGLYSEDELREFVQRGMENVITHRMLLVMKELHLVERDKPDKWGSVAYDADRYFRKIAPLSLPRPTTEQP